MSDIAVTISPESADDAVAIEHLHERTFGPGRYAKTAYRLREVTPHDLPLSFVAHIGTLMVGSVRLSRIRVGEKPALLLGPLTIEPPFRSRGIGMKLIQRALEEARKAGHRLIVLVGDEPYYARAGFRRIPKGKVKLPGPVDPARLLVAELAEGAATDLAGAVRPEWEPA